MFLRWHQDIKPENILWCDDEARASHQWTFKLIYLGSSHLKIKLGTAAIQEQRGNAEDAHGTCTYGEYKLLELFCQMFNARAIGAPKDYRPEKSSPCSNFGRDRSADIWSLGCVYREVAKLLIDKGHKRRVNRRQNSKFAANAPDSPYSLPLLQSSYGILDEGDFLGMFHPHTDLRVHIS
jgi:serine/threonine protein kinase